MATDLKNLIEVTFSDDGVSVFICVMCCVFFLFTFIFIIIFILVDVGRPSGGDTRKHYPHAVAAVSKKEGKLNNFIICVTQFILYNFVLYI